MASKTLSSRDKKKTLVAPKEKVEKKTSHLLQSSRERSGRRVAPPPRSSHSARAPPGERPLQLGPAGARPGLFRGRGAKRVSGGGKVVEPRLGVEAPGDGGSGAGARARDSSCAAAGVRRSPRLPLPLSRSGGGGGGGEGGRDPGGGRGGGSGDDALPPPPRVARVVDDAAACDCVVLIGREEEGKQGEKLSVRERKPKEKTEEEKHFKKKLKTPPITHRRRCGTRGTCTFLSKGSTPGSTRSTFSGSATCGSCSPWRATPRLLRRPRRRRNRKRRRIPLPAPRPRPGPRPSSRPRRWR